MPLIYGPTAQGTGSGAYDQQLVSRFRSERFPTAPQSFASGAGPSRISKPVQRFPFSRPPQAGESSRFYGSQNPKSGVFETGWGVKRPKLLSMRRFTSRWQSPSSPGRPAFGGLTQNPMYSGSGAEGFGRGPGFGGTYSFGQRTGLPGYRSTV
jgi:hypothetical protein